MYEEPPMLLKGIKVTRGPIYLLNQRIISCVGVCITLEVTTVIAFVCGNFFIISKFFAKSRLSGFIDIFSWLTLIPNSFADSTLSHVYFMSRANL